MRIPRYKILRKNGIYHVTNRVNRKEALFRNAFIKKVLEEALIQCKKKHKFELLNYEIMDNHIHLEIKPNEQIASLPVSMHWFFCVTAMRINKILKKATDRPPGRLWGDRYRCKLVRTVIQHIRTFFYIAENAVRAGIVDHPLEYEYGGLYRLFNGNHKGLLDPPPSWMWNHIVTYLDRYDLEKAKRVSKTLSFRSKKRSY